MAFGEGDGLVYLEDRHHFSQIKARLKLIKDKKSLILGEFLKRLPSESNN